MTAGEGTFEGAGGVSIHWRRAEPPGRAPRGVVLVAHGYAEHVGRYREFVAHLVGRGLAVAALDHRGHGRSGGPRGHCLDFAELVADLRRLADEASGWWPGAPRLLFGHSMGGVVALRYLLRHPDTVRAAALSAPALRVLDAGPEILRRVATLVARVAPGVGFTARLDPDALARDPAVGAAYVADPLVHRRASAGFVRAFGAAQAAAIAEAPRLAVPLLVLQGDADRIVDPAAARELADRLTCPHELVMLPGYYHELLNEPEQERDRVLARLERWFDRWLASPA
jgi:alpha-beta hydrolase superfamily lysophospholipase